MFDILQRTGEPLFQKDGQWRSVEHDSLVVTPGKGYYWFSRAEGSKSPIDYFVNVHGMGFQELYGRCWRPSIGTSPTRPRYAAACRA